MQFSFIELKIKDKNGLVSFLTGERWDFHSLPQIPADKVTRQLENGYFW